MRNKLLLLPVLSGLLIAGCGAPKFYKANGSKIMVLGEKNTLTFSNDLGIKRSGMPYLEEGDFGQKSIPGLAVPALALGTNLISSQLKSNAKSFATEFQIRKTFVRNDQTSKNLVVPGFKINRSYVLKGSGNVEGQSMSMSFQAISDTVGKSSFYFVLSELFVKNSRARIKAGFPFNDYVINIAISYIENGEKKQFKFSPLSIPMVRLDRQNSLLDVFGHPMYVTDRIPIKPDFVFSEIEVTVVESNIYKLRSEKVVELYDNNKDKGQELINVILQSND